jgi:hypothetical protein
VYNRSAWTHAIHTVDLLSLCRLET